MYPPFSAPPAMPKPCPCAGLRLAPAEFRRGMFEHGAKPGIVEIPQPELERVKAQPLGQFVHQGLAGEVVGRRRQRPVRALPLGDSVAWKAILELVRGRRSWSWRLVGRAEPGCAGVVVVKLPGSQLAVLVDAGRGFDQTGGAEVGPGELLLAGPDELHRLSRGASQPGGLDRGLVGMLAAVAAARVRHQHPDAILRQMKCLRELLSGHRRGAGFRSRRSGDPHSTRPPRRAAPMGHGRCRRPWRPPPPSHVPPPARP